MKRTAVVLARDRTTRLLLCSTLSSRHWWVGGASSPPEARALLATFRVDLILIDLLNLEWRELLDLCRCSRRFQWPTNITIVVLASDEENTTIRTELRQVVDGVCHKPYSPRAVLDWLYATFPNA